MLEYSHMEVIVLVIRPKTNSQNNYPLNVDNWNVCTSWTSNYEIEQKFY